MTSIVPIAFSAVVAAGPAGEVVQRRIAHLDMDAFFASVELLRYPQLQGLPVVIGGSRRKAVPVQPVPAESIASVALHHIPLADFARLKNYAGRGVVTTATYAARKFGIGSAMGLMKAAELCPDAIILPVDFDEIRRYAALFKQAVARIAPVVEDRGIDEVYIDISEVPGASAGGGLALAQRIQQSVFAATGLTCSIGVAPNKLLAKIASELRKPNGITIVQTGDLQGTIWPLACRKINGIGPKADAKLAQLGIHTVGDLAAQSPALLVAHFGKASGPWLHEAAWGRDERPVQTHTEPVSMSRETTFERDLHALQDRLELGQILTGLCARLAADLQRKGFAARTVGIKLRYADFTIATRDTAAPQGLQSAEQIRQVAGLCLKRVPLEQRLRLLGVRASSLVRLADGAQTQSAATPATIFSAKGVLPDTPALQKALPTQGILPLEEANSVLYAAQINANVSIKKSLTPRKKTFAVSESPLPVSPPNLSLF